MAGLLDDLLDVSKITQGQIDLHRQRTSVASIIESSLEVARPLIEVRRHQLTVSLPPEPIEVDCDPLRLSQVFSNLLTNAAKYTEPGGRIDLLAQADHGGVSIIVRDTGARSRTGIDFADFRHLLTGQEHAAPRGGWPWHRACAGQGPGRAARRSRQRCQRRPRPRQRVPRLAALTRRQRQGARTRRRRPRPPGAVEKRRILVVDDNEDAAQSLGFLLELSGHELHIASDGEQALAMAATVKPDIALVDIGLPKLNGYGVAKAIRAEAWGARIVLIALDGVGAGRGQAPRHRGGLRLPPDQAGGSGPGGGAGGAERHPCAVAPAADLEARGCRIRADAPLGAIQRGNGVHVLGTESEVEDVKIFRRSASASRTSESRSGRGPGASG